MNVEVRVVFLKIGEIDTLKEMFRADAFIQMKWPEPRLTGKTDEVWNTPSYLSLLNYCFLINIQINYIYTKKSNFLYYILNANSLLIL